MTFAIFSYLESQVDFFPLKNKILLALDSKEEVRQYSDAALRLEAIIQTATDGIIIIDENGIIEELNPAASKLFGYDKEELIGQNINRLMPSPHHENHHDYIRNYLLTGQRKIIGIGREVQGKRKDGQVFPFRLSISEVMLHNRRIFTGIVHDLTEQKKAERALREEKERAQTYFDLASTINTVLDHKGRIVELNKKGCAFIGKEEEEVIGQNWFDLILEGEELQKARQIFQDMMTGKIDLVSRYENAVYNLEGEPRYIVWYNNFIHDPRGKVNGLIISGTDITERRQAEKALQREKEKAQQYLDVANTIIVVINLDGNISLLNRKGLELLGYQEEEALGHNWFELAIPPEYRQEVRTVFDTMMTGEPELSDYQENPVITQTGEQRLIAWRNALLRDDQGQPVATISSGVDITEQHAAEERIRKLNAELEERVEQRTEELAEAVNQLLNINHQLEFEIQERKTIESQLRQNEQELRKAFEKEKELSELKSRFVSMASHEFRTPLSTILSSADLIEAYTEAEQQSRREKHTQRIKSAVANLIGILNDFLSLSRLEEGFIEPQSVEFELTAFCHEVFDELQGLLKPGQEIYQQGLQEETFVTLDRKFLKNILFNLLSNAIKYSHAGKPIDCLLAVEDQKLTIGITDRGIGIPEEEQQHLFTRFFRARNVENIQGTGLGLNIVKRYVELMHGSITFESALGKGTTFTVIIPLKNPEP